jgi:hypothetical protein
MLCCSISAAAAAEPEHPPDDPTDGYEPRTVEGWPVLVHRKLIAEKPDVLAEVVKIMAGQLRQVKRVVPAEPLAEMRKVRIWIELHNPKQGGACYHPDRGWLKANKFNLDKHRNIEIAHAEGFIRATGHQPWVMLHELSHAYHHRVLSFEEPRIIAAFERARDAGLYKDVLLYNGRTVRHYALSNHKEFFAECSEAYFGSNDFYPFVRAELAVYDPQTLELLSEIWGDKPAKSYEPPPRNPQPPAEFDPTTAYEVQQVEGWRVLVHKRLIEERADTAAAVLEQLAYQLHLITRVVSAGPVAELKKIPIWIEHHHPRHPCACYHPDIGWLKANGFNPDKHQAVEIANPDNFLEWTKQQPWMVLHELAHGYHDRVLGFNDERVLTQFSRMRKAGQYEKVLRWNGKPVRHYSLTDHKEYFAEATEAFFGVNDYYPFVRAQLREHDREMFDLLREIWDVGGSRRGADDRKAD